MVPSKLTSSKLSEPWITNYIKQLIHRKQCQCEYHLALNNYISTLNSNAIIKKLWSYIKSWKQDCIGVVPLNYQGTTITDAIAKINVLVTTFHLFLNQARAGRPRAPGFLKLLWSACRYACVCPCVRPRGH